MRQQTLALNWCCVACSKIMTVWSENSEDMKTSILNTRMNALSSDDLSRKVIMRSLYSEVTSFLHLLCVV